MKNFYYSVHQFIRFIPTLVFLLIVLFITSCKKDSGGFLSLGEGGETTIKGKVTAKGSGKAVAGVEVLLKSQDEGEFTALFSVEKSVLTDANGNYSISFIADRNRNYEVQPKHALYNNLDSYKS